VHSPFLRWRNVPIRSLLETELERPVAVDNDVNALAVAEMLFGLGQSARAFAVVTVGRGIGSGLVLDGQVYRGWRGGAGEFGHTVAEAGGRLCECGKRGCLEAYASETALVRQVAERFPEVLAASAGSEGVERVLAAVRAGHPGVRQLLAEAGRRLGVALANLVNLFNPEFLVIGGEGVRLGEDYFRPMEEALRENVFDGLGEGLAVHIQPWGDEAWARGAAGLAIEGQVFAGPRWR